MRKFKVRKLRSATTYALHTSFHNTNDREAHGAAYSGKQRIGKSTP